MKTGIKRLEKGYETTMKEVDTAKTSMQENRFSGSLLDLRPRESFTWICV